MHRVIPLSIILVLGATLMLPIAYDPDLFDASDQTPAIGLTYTSHAPINLATNGDFNLPNSTTGISWGNGTKDNPYVITGWEIDAAGTQSAISISFSNVYFQITNCLLYNATDQNILIRLASNGALINNSCSDCIAGPGIKIAQSSKQNISGNNCTGNAMQGIYIANSGNISISDNICNSNNDSGIFLASSNDNLLSGNLCRGNPLGMLILGSKRNNFTNNNLSSNSGVGIWMGPTSRDNRIWNNTFYHNNGTGNSYNPSNSQAYDAGNHTLWNTSGLSYNYGNYWRDMTSPDNKSPYGIVDIPYRIAGLPHSNDSFPLTTVPAPPTIPEAPIAMLALIIVAVFSIARGVSKSTGSRKRLDKHG
jgi:parallel beta-helix repeat protein